MSKLLLIAIVILSVSCSKEEQKCNCKKNTYETKVHMTATNVYWREELISTQTVPCQDEKVSSQGKYVIKVKCE